MRSALLGALLLTVAAALPAAAAGDYEGQWVAKGIDLRLTETRAVVKGKLVVSGGSLSLNARIEKGRISGTLIRKGRTIEFVGYRRGPQLHLEVVFDAGKDGRRFYLLSRVKRFTSVYTTGSETDDLVLVLGKKNGDWWGRLRVQGRTWRLREIGQRHGGGLTGRLGIKGTERFTFQPVKGEPGLAVLSWPNNSYRVRRLPRLRVKDSAERLAEHRPSDKAYRCRIPASWDKGRAMSARGTAFNLPKEGELQKEKPLVLIAHEPTPTKWRGKRPLQRLHAERNNLQPNLVQWIRLEGLPRFSELAVEDRAAGIALWSGRMDDVVCRVWVGSVLAGDTTVSVLMICKVSDLKRFEPQVKRVLGSVREP